MAKQYPSYLNLTSLQWEARIQKAHKELSSCKLCPWNCKVNRMKNSKKGFCMSGRNAVVAHYFPFFGAEDMLVGNKGTGMIFFANTNMSCVYCQNYKITQIGGGQELDKEELAEVMINLQKEGCHNIHFFSPTVHTPQILESVALAVELGLHIPIVYNSNAYEDVGILKLWSGIVDIYVPDFKYSDEKLARKYSFAPNYPNVAFRAIKEMHKQVGDLTLNASGLAEKGLLVRHLVLPNDISGTKGVAEFLSKKISKQTVIHLMGQYHPFYKAEKYPEIERAITEKEYEDAFKKCKKAGLKRIYKVI